MIRKILDIKKISLNDKLPFTKNTVGEELIKPTKIYVKEILPLVKKNLVNSIAHITGGGIYENLERALPTKLMAKIDFKHFRIPEIFLWLKKLGSVDNKEMLKTFNCGIGLIIIISMDKKTSHRFIKRK